MDKIAERLKADVEKQDGVDKALTGLGEAVKRAVEDHKGWLDVQLRKAHDEIILLTNERDLLVSQLLKAKRIINQIKQDIQA
jgi:tRNA splicing ligase